METNHQAKTIALWVLGALVIVAIIYGFVGSFKSSDKDDAKNNPAQSSERAITVRHQFRNGKHTVIGDIDLPTPCYKLAVAHTAGKSNPVTHNIDLTTSTSGDFCAQVITTKPFKITFAGAKDDKITATLDGKPLILNIIHASDSENLEETDPYSKG